MVREVLDKGKDPLVQKCISTDSEVISVDIQRKKNWKRLARGNQSVLDSTKLSFQPLIKNKRESSDLLDHSFVQVKKMRREVVSECDVMTDMAEAVVQPRRAL